MFSGCLFGGDLLRLGHLCGLWGCGSCCCWCVRHFAEIFLKFHVWEIACEWWSKTRALAFCTCQHWMLLCEVRLSKLFFQIKFLCFLLPEKLIFLCRINKSLHVFLFHMIDHSSGFHLVLNIFDKNFSLPTKNGLKVVNLITLTLVLRTLGPPPSKYPPFPNCFITPTKLHTLRYLMVKFWLSRLVTWAQGWPESVDKKYKIYGKNCLTNETGEPLHRTYFTNISINGCFFEKLNVDWERWRMGD